MTRATLNRVRILVGDMPRMLREIVEDAVGLQADMELVDQIDGDDLSTAIRVRQAAVAIVAEAVADGPGHEQLLVDNPQLKLFVLTGDGMEAHLLEFRHIPVSEVSPQGLVNAIRAAVGSSAH
jgi:hypothetical protein